VITEQQLVGLLQRADWTKLSISAAVSRSFNRALRDEQLRSMPPPPWPPPWTREMLDPDDMPMALGDEASGSLIVAPGCRFREELTDESGHTTITGCDGHRVWVVDPRVSRAQSPAAGRSGAGTWRAFGGGSPRPPFGQLLSPSWLLKGCELRIEGAATGTGREAWSVVAVPEALRPTTLEPRRYVLIVDAELGILLRYEVFVRGLPLSLQKLDELRMQPPETDESLFTEPPDALPHMRDFVEELMPPGLSTAAGLAADALGFVIRHGPAGPRQPTADGGQPMPPDPADVSQEAWPPVGDERAYLLYRASSDQHDLAAELSNWTSAEAFTEGLRRGEWALRQGGVGRLADAITEKATPGARHRVARVRYAGSGERYRLDWVVGATRGKPVTESSDGQTRWRVYPDRTLAGPARSAPLYLAGLLQASWLLEWRLADGGEEIVDGRRGYRVRATRVPGATVHSGPSLIYDAAVAVIDAELGIITRLTTYAAGRQIERWELRDIRRTASADAAEFRAPTAPEARVEQESGPFDEAPEPIRQAVRTAEQIGRVVGPVVSRAAGFLGSLKSRGQS
jgi:hypothetical protein